MSKDIIKLCIVGSLLFSSSLYSNDGFTKESEAFDDVDDFGGDEEIIIEKIDGIDVATVTTMTTKQGKRTLHKTVLIQSDVKMNQDLKEDMFTTRTIEKGL